MISYIEEIKRLKKEKNAIILAHFYQPKEIQEIADYLGDSLKLAQIAKESNADILVFCGVHFMAETAKILNPEKKVLLPVMNAGCLMADMITGADLRQYKLTHPKTKIITYVNSSAEVKAESDCICTSTNALKIIKHYTDQKEPILYCPDQNLAKYAMKEGNISFDAWNGCCPIHHDLDIKEVLQRKKEHPNALILAHPECQLSILDLADYVGSTKQLLDYVKVSSADTFIICTEEGVLHAMKRVCPEKCFILAHQSLVCPSMKYTTLKDVYACLSEEINEIKVPEELSKKAKIALERMLKLS